MGTTMQDIIGSIRHSADGLVRNLNAMPADKLNWKPLDAGRSALQMAVECGVISHSAAKTLNTRQDPVMDMDEYQRIQTDTDTAEKAAALLSQGTDAVIAAIEAFPAEHIDGKVKMPWGQEITFGDLMKLIHWNNVYHTGQIAYIQTLYGDKEMH
jgi:hypothetical protein